MDGGSMRSRAVEITDAISHNRTLSILTVGDAGECHRKGSQLRRENLAFVSFDDLCECTLDHHRPSIIVSPVLAKGFDCIDLALLLRNLGFKGEYRAIAKDLPKPELIEREVAQMCPSLKFKISLQS